MLRRLLVEVESVVRIFQCGHWLEEERAAVTAMKFVSSFMSVYGLVLALLFRRRRDKLALDVLVDL